MCDKSFFVPIQGAICLVFNLVKTQETALGENLFLCTRIVTKLVKGILFIKNAEVLMHSPLKNMGTLD